MYCTNCGKENPDTNKFCLQCGQPLVAGAIRPNAVAPSPAPPRPSRRLPLILGGVLLLAALAAAAWFLLPRLQGGGREMLLAIPDRNGEEYDLAVLRLGDELEEAVVIAEGVQDVRSDEDAYAGLSMKHAAGDTRSRSIGGRFGGFLPGADRVVAYFHKDGETHLLEYAIGDEDPVELVSEENGRLIGLYSADTGDLFIFDYTASSAYRCYLAAPGEEAERVARGDGCSLTGDRRGVITRDSNSAGEITVTVTNLESGHETTLLDEVRARLDVAVSADGSHVVFRPIDENGNSVVLADATGETIFTSDEFDEIRSFGFAGQSDTFYFIARDGDEWKILTATSEEQLLSAPALDALALGDDTTTVVTADEDGVGEVLVVALSDGTVTHVVSGDNLWISWTANPDRLLIRQEADGDLVLMAAELSGANPLILFDDNDYILSDTIHIDGENHLYLPLANQDGQSLYVAPLDGAPGFFALEEWFEIVLLNSSGDTLLFKGREDSGDDEKLYALPLSEDADLIELDDTADSYGHAVIAPDGRTVIYNAAVGDRPDDLVVRRVRLDGQEPPEDLYEEVNLAAARWAEIDPFGTLSNSGRDSLSWTDAGQLALQTESTAGEVVPVVTEVQTGGFEEINDEYAYSGAIDVDSYYSLGGDGGEGFGKVYTFRGRAGQEVRFEVLGNGSLSDSSLDPTAKLLDEDMNLLLSDDDGGEGSDARITYTLPHDGRYYLVVASYSGGYGTGDDLAYQVWMFNH